MPRRLSLVIAVSGICLVALLMALPALAQPYDKYSDIPTGTAPAPPVDAGPPAAPVGDLSFYTDRGAFLTDYPAATSEDYSGTSVPPNGVSSCVPPMNSASNDACFTPGAIVDGVSIDVVVSGGGGEGVVLTPPFFGTTSVSVGPNSFTDDMTIDFPTPVRSMGLDLVCPNGAVSLNVEVFGTTGSLGTTTAACGGPPGNFWGVSSAADTIVSVTFVGPGDSDAELASNVLFMIPVPTMGAPAMALLVVVLMAISAFFVRRRRTV